MSEQHFEMLWNCVQCGASGLLAKSQRHCPACGSPQDPAKRYFPEPGQEVEVSGHRFVGADWRCAFCQSPNGAAAEFCANCGGPKDGTKAVATVADPLAAPVADGAAPAPVAPKAAGKPWGKMVLGLLAAALSALTYQFFSQHEETVKVAGRSWTREIRVERFQPTSDSAWCAELPSAAYEVRRSSEVKETRQVEDGQSCREKRVDVGDGTFTRKQECSPRYRDESVHADKCQFKVNRWSVARTETTRGDTAQAPTWPALQLASGGQNMFGSGGGSGVLGAEREAGRSEKLVIDFAAPGGKTFNCAVAADKWARYSSGQEVRLKVRGTGGAVCDSLP